MEALLPVKTCVRCGHAYVFHMSRFGCVYSCACDERIDALKAAAAFAAELRGRAAETPFVPLMSSSSCELTDRLKVAAVQLDFANDVVVAEFLNFTDAELEHVRAGLTLALRGHLRPSGTALSGPATVADQLVHELLECAQDPLLSFFVNAPAPGLRERVSGFRNGAAPGCGLDGIPPLLRRTLMQHQVDGVRTALRWGGRILFADDMGVGKTMQALATVAALEAFPLLIVCPSAVKVMWADLVEQYLHEQVPMDAIHVVHGSNDALGVDTQPKVVLVSYHMAAVLEKQLRSRSWQCLVCDESHLLHTNVNGVDATYTRVAVELGKCTPYCLLLSGTPAIDAPFDLFNQIDMLRPGLLGNTRFEFAMRYCHVSLSPYLHVGAAARRVELTSLLRSCCMLRRLKQDVLELPCKSRVVMRVANRPSPRDGLPHLRANASYQERYADSWKANWRGIVEAVEHCCGKYERVVLLAHHIELIDALVRWLGDRRQRVVRIDGRVPAQQRGDLLDTFRRGDARVAVVGITACAVGISLAPAQCAVFCELPPDAAWMRQAEDRLHRPGQRDEVVIHYLLGIHSHFDAELFSRLCRSTAEAEQPASSHLALAQVARARHHPPQQLQPQPRDVASPSPIHSAAAPPTAVPLLFCVSRNTGRIHVRASERAGLYTTLLWDEAQECVRQRRDPVWKQLSAFLDSVARLSPFHRRQLVLRHAWLPLDFDWGGAGEATAAPRQRRSRYLRTRPVGWGVWWEVRRLYFPTRHYFGPLTLAADTGYTAGCLNCATRLTQVGGSLHVLVPGSICCIANSDSDLFCSGKCRHSFFIRRSSGAVRRTVAGVDKSVCSNCHVDCELLCTSVAAVAGRRAREAVIRKLHPQMLHFPTLAARVIVNPVPGNFWHADHVLPVACGGGEATLDNLQTLCVVCHALKTKDDMKQVRQQRTQPPPPTQEAVARTTVDVAWTKTALPSDSRVTRRRL
ncbi:SNF2/RAD54 related DNA helicase [Novymonas esmeraldas]|uniref:SNF2/RAD54 related DNA helicase n=1 Tax=Novymonas esmeraldas TaxID=1808958 RepID=A0AAW0F4E8_9TRYP